MLKMNLISTAFALLLLSGSLVSAAVDHPINSHEPSKKDALHIVPFISIEKICQDRVILDFHIWYEAWSMKYIQENNDKSGTDLNQSMIGEVETHIKQLKAYIEALEGMKPAITLLPPLHMDVKVSKLNSDINQLLHSKDAENKFEDIDLQNKLQKEHGFYTPQLIDDINKTPFSNDLITSVADAFESDWDIQEDPQGELMSAKVNELAGPLRKTLKLIIKIFANIDDLVYKSLDHPTKDSLQLFFNKFMFLLTPEEIRKEVLKNLVGTEVPQEIAQNFFDKDVFNKLNNPPTVFSNPIHRDMFITLPNTETNLENIHKAVHPQLFSWPFLGEFDSKASDLQLGTTKKEREVTDKTTTDARKRAKLGLMMYKVYLFARLDGTLPHDEEFKNQEILQKLFDWVKDTEAFNPIKPEIDEEGSEFTPLATNDYAQLFEASKFKKYFVPLLHFICNKIDGCRMLSEENKPRIIEQFEKFGNFEQLKANERLASLVPTEILDEINKSIEDNEIRRLEENLDDMLDLPSESDDTDSEEEPLAIHRKKSTVGMKPLKDDLHNLDDGVIEEPVLEDKPVVIDADIPKAYQIKKKGPTKMLAQVSEKHEAAFKPIVNKFLPPTGEINQKSKDFIDKYLEKAEVIGKDKKKSIMITLLIKHVLTRFKDDEKLIKDDPEYDESNRKVNPTTEIINTINNKMVAKLRASYSFSGTAGLKNFFMKALSSISTMHYLPSNQEEQALFRNDIILFVYFAQEDRLLRAAKDSKLKRTELVQIKKEVVYTNNNLHGHLFDEETNKNSFDDLRKVVRKEILENPLLMERMPAYEFFIHFLDMFNYFENVESSDKAETTGFSDVYMNFYTFLNTVRSEIYQDVENPHEFVLERLEHCLLYTENIEKLTVHSYDANCKMSHRKYAEMYYFYKIYLLANHKPVAVSLSPYPQTKFDAHSRIFLNFVREYPSPAFEDICKATPKEAICASSHFFRILSNYVQNDKLSANYLVSEIKKVYNKEDPVQKFHFLAGVEALNLHLVRGNMKIWERIMSLMKELTKAHMDFFNFQDSDIPMLSNFLKRTYRKLVFSDKEARVAMAVQKILEGEYNPMFIKDSFGSYLVHGGIVYLDYVKIFLLLSTTTAEFDRIAKFIVDSKSGNSLIRMNDPQYNNDYDIILSRVGNQELSLKDRYKELRVIMSEKYEASRQVCNNIIKRRIIVEEPLDQKRLDDYQDLFGNYDDENEANLEEEERNFEKINSKLQSAHVREPEKMLLGEQIIQFELQRSVSSELVDDIEEEEGQLEIHYEMNDSEDSEGQKKIAKMYLNGKEVSLQEGFNLQNKINANMQKMALKKGDIQTGDYIIGTEGDSELNKELLSMVIKNNPVDKTSEETGKDSRRSVRNNKLI